MVYHTIVPHETLFEGFDTFEPTLVQVERAGRRMWFESGTDGAARLVRITSTDPADYLKPDWSPGSLWRLAPTSNAD